MSPHDPSLLTSLADGELEGSARERLEAHLRRCTSCRDTVEASREARRAMRATATLPEPSEQAYFRLRYAVAARRRWHVIRTALAAGLVAGVCAGLAAAAVGILRPSLPASVAIGLVFMGMATVCVWPLRRQA